LVERLAARSSLREQLAIERSFGHQAVKVRVLASPKSG